MSGARTYAHAGTFVSDRLMALEKKPTSIVFHGDSPSDAQAAQGLREVDVLMHGVVEIYFEKAGQC